MVEKTYDELIAQARKCMNEVTNYPTKDETTHVIANGLSAIAHILLAKEKRETAVEITGTPEYSLDPKVVQRVLAELEHTHKEDD